VKLLAGASLANGGAEAAENMMYVKGRMPGRDTIEIHHVDPQAAAAERQCASGQHMDFCVAAISAKTPQKMTTGQASGTDQQGLPGVWALRAGRS
jgi:hypothetical protein